MRQAQGLSSPRELGPGAEVTVEAGCRVDPDTLIGRSRSGSRVIRLPLEEGRSAELSVLKRAGESIRRGEPLLRQAGLFGLMATDYVCPVDGYVEELLLAQRAVLIREHTSEVRAGVSGRVSGVLPGRGVVLEFDGTAIRLFAGWGPPVCGLLAPAAELFSPADIGRNIDESLRGRVIWATSTLCAEAIVEAARVEAAGIIAGSVSLVVLQAAAAELRQRTGRARLPLTLLISEGFGSAPMAAPFIQALSQAVGQVVYLDPGERDELAWIREPEASFSPGQGPPGANDAVLGEAGGEAPPAGETTPALVPLSAGMTVRLVDLDRFNQPAVVVGPPTVTRLETGATATCVAVRLPDGSRAVVPVLNVEILDPARPPGGGHPGPLSEEEHPCG